jgi:hypothetical protein
MAKEDGNGRRNKRRKDDLQGVMVICGISYLPDLTHNRKGDGKVFLTPEEAKRNIENTLRANADRPLFTGTAVCPSSIGSSFHFVNNNSGRQRKDLYTLVYTLRLLLLEVLSCRGLVRNIYCRWGRPGWITRFVYYIFLKLPIPHLAACRRNSRKLLSLQLKRCHLNLPKD